MAEKAEQERAKLEMKRLKVAQMDADLQIRGRREAMQNASEIARLRA
jgi:hypothetical protein